MSPGLNILAAEEFPKKILKAGKTVLVELSVPWCGPSKMLEPVLSELADQQSGRVQFHTINIDDT